MRLEAKKCRRGSGWPALAALLTLAVAACAPAMEGVAPRPAASDALDARVGLRAGWHDAEQVAWNMEQLAHRPRPQGFFNPVNPGDGSYANTDMGFQGDYVYVGSYHGFQIWNVADPRNPRLRTAVVCPGGQGDISVQGNLLFMSVEERRARVDCGPQGVTERVSPERFLGVRIFDISDLDAPRQIAAVQTCRGSHTHTLLNSPGDVENLYVYVSGTSVVRPAEELPGCVDVREPDAPGTSYWSIAVIQVPLAAPHQARVVSEPRVFMDAATGAVAGLWPGGDHGPATQRTSMTHACHDITLYPALGLGAGACSGNGILLDISDPVNPQRIDEVVDANFAYWHSATFSNDGSKVIFTDEWGGGSAPRCRAEDPEEWGANAIFDLVDGRLRFASYYKLPAPQTAQENCVAHNGSLVPVPGRDIKVQAWYQGGISVFDFTDSANPVEIAYFDRGPLSAEQLLLGGYWSAYWHNGYVYGSEIARGLDVFQLVPSEHLSRNEIEAARLVRFETFNPQEQPRISWPASFVVARAYLDQLERSAALPADVIAGVRRDLAAAESASGEQRRAALATLEGYLAGVAPLTRDAQRLRALSEALRELGR